MLGGKGPERVEELERLFQRGLRAGQLLPYNGRREELSVGLLFLILVLGVAGGGPAVLPLLLFLLSCSLLLTLQLLLLFF